MFVANNGLMDVDHSAMEHIPRYLLTNKGGFESYLKMLREMTPMEFFEPANLSQFDEFENVGFRIYHKKEKIDKYYLAYLKELSKVPELRNRKISKVYQQIQDRLEELKVLAKDEINSEYP